MRSVEKLAGEDRSAQRLFEWVIRHADWIGGRGLQPVYLTGGYCWSFCFHTTWLLSLYRIFNTPGPAMKV